LRNGADECGTIAQVGGTQGTNGSVAASLRCIVYENFVTTLRRESISRTDRRVLIIAVEQNHRGALAASRALAGSGWHVGIGSPTEKSLAASSRSTRHWHHVPSPERGLSAFLNAVQAAVSTIGYEIILPGGDAETLALSSVRDSIDAVVPYPQHEDVVRAFDKLELARGAQRAGLRTPHTVVATDEALAKTALPIVVKSRLHWSPGDQSAPRRWETSLHDTRTGATARVSQIRAAGGDPLLQELISGRLMHCHIIVDRRGEITTCVQQLSEPLTWPPDAGTRVRSITIPVDEDLKRKNARFLSDLNWFGFASLQFIQAASREPMLVDFNGRLSMSFEQSIAAGSNLPALWAAVSVGAEPGPIAPAALNVRFQWLEGDIQRAIIQRRVGLIRDVFDCLSYARGAVHGLWRIDDPRPALRYWPQTLSFAARTLWHTGKKEQGAPSIDQSGSLPCRQEEVDEHFRKQSSCWDRLYEDTGLRGTIYRKRQAVALRLVDDLGLPPGSDILEIGSGAGSMSLALAERGHAVQSIDSTAAMVELTRQLAKESGFADTIVTAQMDAHSLGFNDNVFDLVVAIGVVSWLHSPLQALHEMARVVKPSGRLLITTLNETALNRLLDPWTNPLLAPLLNTLKSRFRSTGYNRHHPKTEAKPLRCGYVDRMLSHAKLQKLFCTTVGFGPFSVRHHPLFSDRTSLVLHSRLQALADHRVPLARSLGKLYIVLALKPVSGPIEAPHQRA